jgi:hypothetical protein
MTVKVISVAAIIAKKVAVGHVHAIHSIVVSPLLNAAQGKALGDVVADKIDNQSTRQDCQNPSRR